MDGMGYFLRFALRQPFPWDIPQKSSARRGQLPHIPGKNDVQASKRASVRLILGILALGEVADQLTATQLQPSQQLGAHHADLVNDEPSPTQGLGGQVQELASANAFIAEALPIQTKGFALAFASGWFIPLREGYRVVSHKTWENMTLVFRWFICKGVWAPMEKFQKNPPTPAFAEARLGPPEVWNLAVSSHGAQACRLFS